MSNFVASNSLLAKLKMVPSCVWLLCIVSMLMNSASVVITAIGPSFVCDKMQGNDATVGTIRALADFISYIVKLFSGSLSDKLGTRKKLMVIGYVCAALTKPGFALATTRVTHMLVYFIERVSNGLRDTPRDALIAESLAAIRGLCFGIRQAGAYLGSTIGAILCIFYMNRFSNNYQAVFLISAIPAVLASLLLIIGLKETPKKPSELGDAKKSTILNNFWSIFVIKKTDLRQFSKTYWLLMLAIFIFMCARWSDAFIMLSARRINIGPAYHSLFLCVYYLSNFCVTGLCGVVTTSRTRNLYIILGIIIFVLHTYITTYATSFDMLLVASIVYGISLGMITSNLSALVASFSPANIMGTAFGIFNLMCAFGTLIANSLFGYLWNKNYFQCTLYIIFSLMLLAIIILWFIKEQEA